MRIIKLMSCFFSMIDLGSAIKIDLPLNLMSFKYSTTHLCSETKENITLLSLDDFTDFERYRYQRRLATDALKFLGRFF